MRQRIAIIGAGPTGVYTLAALIGRATAPLALHLFEAGPQAGVGMPYKPTAATPEMLANIASIEIPPLTQTYLDWMRGQPAERLAPYGLTHADLHDRLFTSRLLVGCYYADELAALIGRARADGHEVTVHEGSTVTDLTAETDGVRVHLADGPVPGLFDHVALASGHDFPHEPDPTARWFDSPWSGLRTAEVPPCRVGILGTSLTAFDAATILAMRHGRFVRTSDGVTYKRAPGTDALRITMMSRKGLLPEADFWCPIPWEPLSIVTPQTLAALPEGEGLLDRVFALFAQELAAADPAYAAAVGLTDLDADSFAPVHLGPRLAADPFAWARNNLAEVTCNAERHHTVAWRYAILRMHEVVETVVSRLTPRDRARFDAGLKGVFVDNYAAVPPDSIRRLIALHEAGVIDVRALGPDYRLTRTETGTQIKTGEGVETYDVMIDARGQRALSVEDIRQPGLRAALLKGQRAGPLTLDADLVPVNAGSFGRRVVIGAIPYLLPERPFTQGLTAVAVLGETIARAMLDDEGGQTRPPS